MPGLNDTQRLVLYRNIIASMDRNDGYISLPLNRILEMMDRA